VAAADAVLVGQRGCHAALDYLGRRGALAVSLLTKAHSGWQRIIFIVLWAYYLSIVNAGQIFMGYQWDWLLLKPVSRDFSAAREIARLALRWLLFRLMFESGAVKLLSGDPSWRHFTALSFHYETQPLPTPLAWYMHLAARLVPEDFRVRCLRGRTGAAVPDVRPAPPEAVRRNRHHRVSVVLIFLTGNYTFFNLLTDCALPVPV
jgi:hypothetical protein